MLHSFPRKANFIRIYLNRSSAGSVPDYTRSSLFPNIPKLIVRAYSIGSCKSSEHSEFVNPHPLALLWLAGSHSSRTTQKHFRWNGAQLMLVVCRRTSHLTLHLNSDVRLYRQVEPIPKMSNFFFVKPDEKFHTVLVKPFASNIPYYFFSKMINACI